VLFFPVAAPDELLYSLLARYARMSGGLPPRTVMRQVFGSENCAAAWDLPCHLGKLSQALDVPVVDLIDRHTLLPYFGSTLLPGRLAMLKRWMTESEYGGTIHAASGVTASSVSATTRLRYCKQCAKEDTREWSAPVWRRTHQCPGVVWCTTHSLPLIETNVVLAARSHKHHAVELRTAMQSGGRALEVPDIAHARIIASRTADLLKGSAPQGAHAWQERHRYLVSRAGFLTPAGRIRWAAMLPVARKILPIRWWQFLGLRSDIEHASHWLPTLLRTLRKGAHPLLHLVTEALLEDLDSEQPRSNKSRDRPHVTAVNASPQRIKTDRLAWRKIASEYPHEGVKAWRSRAPGLYMRLYRHSNAWLHAWNDRFRKSPAVKRLPRLDWDALDRSLVCDLQDVFRSLANAPQSRRRRITKTSLLRQLRTAGLHRTQLAKLPILRSALHQMAESEDQFLRRRLGNAVRDWARLAPNQLPAPWQILRSAGVRAPWSANVMLLARSMIDLHPWILRQYQEEEATHNADQGLAAGTPCGSNAGRRGVT